MLSIACFLDLSPTLPEPSSPLLALRGRLSAPLPVYLGRSAAFDEGSGVDCGWGPVYQPPSTAFTGYPWGMAGTAALSVTIHVLDVVVIAVLLLLYLLVKVWRRV